LVNEIRFQTNEELNYIKKITLELIHKIKTNLDKSNLASDERDYLLSNYFVLENFLEKINQRKALL